MSDKKEIIIKEMREECIANGLSGTAFYHGIKIGKIERLGKTNDTASRDDFNKWLKSNRRKNCGRKPKIFKEDIDE